MTESVDISEEMGREPRPGFLTVLCVLSFISTGMGLVSGFVTTLMGPSSDEQMLEAKVEMTKTISDVKELGVSWLVDLLEKIQAMSEQINENFYLASIMSLLVVIFGFYAVLKMYRGFKLGFHLYIGYCLLSIVSLYFYVSAESIPSFIVIFNLLFSGLFIFLYSRNLHWMR